MPVLLMAVVGLAAGFVLDEVIARLAREPYMHDDGGSGDAAGEAAAGAPSPALPGLVLGGEAGALAMPRALTTAAIYRRAAVVATTSALFAVAAMRYDGHPVAMAIVALYLAALIVCTGTDVLAYRVPNVITYPAIVAAIVVGMVAEDANRWDVVFGGVLEGGTFLVMSIVTRGGMGMGDVKLAFFVGFALGLTLAVGALVITAIAGGVIAVVLLAAKLRDRRDPIPYAPFIAGGAAWVLLAQGTAFFAF